MPLVLVVDDERAIAETLREVLAWEGFDAIVAFDGEEALEMARARPPDLVVTDFMMPKMDGATLAGAIRGDTALARARIVLMTAAFVDPAREAPPYDALLRKPFDAETFMRVVRRMLPNGAPR